MLVLSNRPSDSSTFSSPVSQFAQLVDRRLDIAGKGLDEARRHLAAGQIEDVDTVLEKLDEDLHLLRRRLSREVETAARRPGLRFGCGSAASESN